MKKLLISLFLLPSIAFCGVCETIYDGDKAVSVIQGKPKNYTLSLINATSSSSQGEVTANQIQSVYNAKEKIQRVVGIYPKFVICGDAEPNAFAFEQQDGAVVGVSMGMLRLINGDEDMAAAVIGHEIAHHTKNHRIRTQQNELVTNIISSLIGLYIEARVQQRYRVAGVGQNLAIIGSALTLSKFSRDQEREADEVGFKYMVESGYNPEGSIRLAEVLLSKGLSSSGLFYESHPSWEERASRFKSFIASSPKAQQLIASKSSEKQNLASLEPNSETKPLGFGSSISLTEAQNNSQVAIKALVDKDMVKFEKYSRLAANAGEPSSQYNLGVMYEKGHVVNKDINQAVNLVKLSANQGFPLAQTKLGFYYLTGLGVPKNEVEGIKWTRLAVEQGEPDAKYNLSVCYFTGLGVQQNVSEGVKWRTQAAEQGMKDAQRTLGSYYRSQKNYSEAIKYYKMAIQQNDGEAYALMAGMYWDGLGVQLDRDESMRLYKLGAKNGFQPAIDYLKSKNISY